MNNNNNYYNYILHLISNYHQQLKDNKVLKIKNQLALSVLDHQIIRLLWLKTIKDHQINKCLQLLKDKIVKMHALIIRLISLMHKVYKINC